MEAGRPADAIDALEMGLTINPSNPHMKEQLDRLLGTEDRG
jgi:hypothetical protein